MSAARVLVTGGAGYIGSHAVLALLDAGIDVVVLDDLSTGMREAVPPGVPFVQASTGDAAALAALFRERPVSAVMHFAASLVVPESVARPLDYWRNNVANTSGRPVPARMAPRHGGDPPAPVARALLGWRPAFDDLDRIVASALTWEGREAATQRRQAPPD